MTLAQLKEAEDEFDEEDMRAIEIYRYSDLFGQLMSFWMEKYKNETKKSPIFAYRIDFKRTKLVFKNILVF